MIKKMEDPQLRWKAGASNRNKKFSPERCFKMHGHRTRESYVHPVSEEGKKNIGRASAAKFTPEYKARYRETMIERGWWIENKTPYEKYFKEADWIERMFDRVEGEELILLKKYGVFSNATNHGGVVRDHGLSRKEGFDQGISPVLLRHPVNCRIILHRDNVSRRFTKKDFLTKDQLFKLIEDYSGDWKEQEFCLKLISEYNLGKRFTEEVMPNV